VRTPLLFDFVVLVTLSRKLFHVFDLRDTKLGGAGKHVHSPLSWWWCVRSHYRLAAQSGDAKDSLTCCCPL